jgi:hypothetical protein
MQFSSKTFRIVLRTLLACTVGLLLTAVSTRAETYLSGTYRCTKVEVAGKTASCSAPSLELKSDGSYQILSERGTYEIVAGRWLVLSTSKNHGKAWLESNKEIVFEFVSGGKKSRITYRRKFKRPPGWMSS